MLNLALLRKDKIELRDYQRELAENVLAKGNSLVVMPTALGKTFVAVLVMADLLERKPEKKILFMAPTKPLVLQQENRVRELIELSGDAVASVTGEVPVTERKKIYESARIICGTPQTIENDLDNRLLSLRDFSLVVFDEAHRTVGDYAYAPIGARAREAEGLIVLGLTASPSHKREKIEEVCGNLGIKNIEIKKAGDADVAPYAKKIDVKWIFVNLPPEFNGLRNELRKMLDEETAKLIAHGFLPMKMRDNKRVLLSLRGTLVRMIPSTFKDLSTLAKALNLLHALELLEAHGASALKNFLEGFETREKQTRAVQALASDYRIKAVKQECKKLIEKGIDHPKLEQLKKIVSENARAGKTMIVFVHYRDSVKKVVEELNGIAGVSAKIFIGRSREGMNQKQQTQVLQDFREKKFNVLCSTSVGEEGLDVPSVDMVVFYEAVPSEIRLIQRRGRAGRVRTGEAIVLVTKDTRDEAYLWASRAKEGKMHAVLQTMKTRMDKPAAKTPAGAKRRKKAEVQKTMGDFL